MSVHTIHLKIPVAICGNVEEQQSTIVLMKNQIAKVYGIQTGKALSSKPAAVSKINVYYQTMRCIFDSAKKYGDRMRDIQSS